ncbi:MAG: hypothetical protein RL262_444 [Bacteroidota bacterium]|jgi:hypothetical protein
MKNYKILLVAIPFMFMACSKGGDSPTPTPPPVVVVPETDLAFKVEIASTEIDYTKIYGAIGGSQAINVNITSTLPKDGVTIDVKVTKDADNTAVFNNNITSTTAASNAITISSLSPGVLSTATVVVTSKTKSTNTATKTFKIAAK